MINLIEELFYGNIEVNGHCCDENENYQSAIQQVLDLEEILMKSLDGELKQLFIKYENANSIVLGESSISHFVMGFKLGARFGFDIFSDDMTCVKGDVAQRLYKQKAREN